MDFRNFLSSRLKEIINDDRLDFRNYPRYFGIVFAVIMFLMSAFGLYMAEPWNYRLDTGKWESVDNPVTVIRSEKARFVVAYGKSQRGSNRGIFRTEFQIPTKDSQTYHGVVFSPERISAGSAVAEQSLKNANVYRLQNTTLSRAQLDNFKGLCYYFCGTFVMALIGVCIAIRQRIIHKNGKKPRRVTETKYDGQMATLDLDFCGEDEDHLYTLTPDDWQEINRENVEIYLNLSCSTITDADINNLAGNSFLYGLTLMDNPHLTGNFLETLRSCKNLKSLVLYDNVDDAALENVAQLRNLETLDLSFNDNITTRGLACLSRLKNLQDLSFSECKKLTDAELAVVARITTLRILDLSACEHITMDGLLSLSQLPSLKEVDLSDCPQFDKPTIKKLKVQFKNAVRFIL